MAMTDDQKREAKRLHAALLMGGDPLARAELKKHAAKPAKRKTTRRTIARTVQGAVEKATAPVRRRIEKLEKR